MEKAAEAEKKHRIPQHTYVSLYSRTSGMESRGTKTRTWTRTGSRTRFPGSRSLRIMMEVFNTPGLSDKQKAGYVPVSRSQQGFLALEPDAGTGTAEEDGKRGRVTRCTASSGKIEKSPRRFFERPGVVFISKALGSPADFVCKFVCIF